MNTEHTINLNSAECLKTASNWGSDTVYNICSGAQHVVPWGTMDYIGYGLACGILVSLVALIVVFVATILIN